MKYEIPTWDEMDGYTRELAQKVLKAKRNFDAIISVERGGACPSRLLSDFLKIPTIYHINVAYYEGINEKREKPLITQTLPCNVENQDILVCDDVSDSGNSLLMVKDYLKEQRCASITTATVYIKPWTAFIPDYYVKQTEAWIVFPWERLEILDTLIEKYYNSDNLEDVKNKLRSAGFPSDLVEFCYSIRALLRESQE